MVNGRITAVTLSLTLAFASGCRLFQRGPSDQEVVAAVEKAPPAPPTLGATYLSEVTSVRVEQRGQYNSNGKYWPVRARVKGGVKVKLTSLFQLGLLGDHEKDPPTPVDFVEEARFTKDDFGGWRVSYNYDPSPAWRINDRDLSRGNPVATAAAPAERSDERVGREESPQAIK